MTDKEMWFLTICGIIIFISIIPLVKAFIPTKKEKPQQIWVLYRITNVKFHGINGNDVKEVRLPMRKFNERGFVDSYIEYPKTHKFIKYVD